MKLVERKFSKKTLEKENNIGFPSSAFIGPSKGTSSNFGVWNRELLRNDLKPDFYM